MAQNLKPNRSDNRGGYKKPTSNKVMFSYRINPEHRAKIVAFIKSLRI